MRKPLPLLFHYPEKKFLRCCLLIFGAVFLLFLPQTFLGNEFKVLSFRKVPNDISAIQNKFKRYDDNDELCAIIKVRSDVPNLRFSASNPVVGNIERRQGEYWVYLSAGTRQLYVFTEGFIKLSYTFPLRIEKGKVYMLEITSRDPLDIDTGKGSLVFSSVPDSVEVTIDGFPDLVKRTPCRFENYRTGSYKFAFKRYRYQTLDTIIHIDRNTRQNIFIRLTPKWGNLVVTSLDTVPYVFQINGRQYTGKKLVLAGEKLGLDAGTYSLRISAAHHYDTTLTVHLVPGDTSFFTIGLKPVFATLRVITDPPGATVFVDGRETGKTPLQQQVIVGHHNIRIYHKDFAEENREITLQKETEKLLDITLLQHVPVRITSNPDGALVYFNGKFKGRTPLTAEVRPGPMLLKLKKDFYQEIKDSVDIRQAKNFSFRLHKEKYQLKVLTTPSGATVFVNGQEVGTTPETFSLEFGNYKVHVGKKGYIPKNKSVALKNNTQVSFLLRRRLKGYLNAVFVFPHMEYEQFKFGGEIGWTYRSAPYFMTALGYAHGYTDNLADELANEVKTIDITDYNGIPLHSLQTDGFAEKETNIFYIKAGIVISKPFTMVVNGTLGFYSQQGYTVYISDNHYTPAFGYGEDINPNDKFMNSREMETQVNPLFGFGFQLKVSYFYFFGDYWISNSISRNGSVLSLGAGLAF